MEPTWSSTNNRVQIGFGNIGGIIATYSFLKADAPNYHTGYSICLSFICLSALSCCLYLASVVLQNRTRSKSHDVGLTEYDKIEMGDMSPDYRYMM